MSYSTASKRSSNSSFRRMRACRLVVGIPDTKLLKAWLTWVKSSGCTHLRNSRFHSSACSVVSFPALRKNSTIVRWRCFVCRRPTLLWYTGTKVPMRAIVVPALLGSQSPNVPPHHQLGEHRVGVMKRPVRPEGQTSGTDENRSLRSLEELEDQLLGFLTSRLLDHRRPAARGEVGRFHPAGADPRVAPLHADPAG